MDEDKTEDLQNVDEEELIKESEEQPKEQELLQEDEQLKKEVEPEEQEQVQQEQPSRRESLRIQQVLNKLKQNNQPQQQPQYNNAPDYRNMIDADEEVYNQLGQQTQNYGQQQYNAGLEQAKSMQFMTRLELDAPKVESQYEFLNKNSKSFNPVVADAISQWYVSTAGLDTSSGDIRVANPGIRYSEFVDGIMDLANEIATSKTQNSTRNITRQAAQTGIRPDGSSAKRLNLNKSPETMTDEELEAMINSSIPKR